MTRFAPSPTGELHIGHAFSALAAYDAAQAEDGRFVLRIEDIDVTRCRPEYEEAIFRDLAWLGLTWEIPVRRQSEHFDDYRAALRTLEEMGVLYPCFCTRAEIAAEIAAMRARIERERARPGRHNIKAGRGGLVDVEFAAQTLQLLHGHDHPELRVRSTMAALAAAAKSRVADAELCALLADGYRFLRTLDHRMRIVHDSSVEALPTGHGLELLARRAGYPDGAALERVYRRWTEDVRRAYEQVISPVDG